MHTPPSRISRHLLTTTRLLLGAAWLCAAPLAARAFDPNEGASATREPMQPAMGSASSFNPLPDPAMLEQVAPSPRHDRATAHGTATRPPLNTLYSTAPYAAPFQPAAQQPAQSQEIPWVPVNDPPAPPRTATPAEQPKPAAKLLFPPVDANVAALAGQEMTAEPAITPLSPRPVGTDAAPALSAPSALPAPAAITPPQPIGILPAEPPLPPPPLPSGKKNSTAVASENPAIAALTPEGTPTLSEESRAVLGKIPGRIDSPKKESPTAKVALQRVSPEIKAVLGQEAAENAYESVGLSIKVRRPGLDTNYELNQAYTALMGGDTSRAIETYKAILSTEPRNEDALFGLAATYHRLGRIAQARPFYAMLLRQNPTHREGLNNFLALVSEESPQDALPELERLEERNPNFSPIPAQIAIVLDKLGFADRAQEKMLQAIALAPDNLTYKYNLAVMLDRRGRYGDAAALYRLLIDAALRGQSVPAATDVMQKRLNYIATTLSNRKNAG